MRMTILPQPHTIIALCVSAPGVTLIRLWVPVRSDCILRT
jgi:hypothetical protein